MVDYSAYVGLNVHKDTISVAVAFPGREDPVFRGEIRNQRSSLRRLIRRLSPSSASATRRAPAGTACIARLWRRVITARWWRRA